MIVAMAWKAALKKDKKQGIQKNYLLNFYHDALVVVKLDQFLC